MTHDEATIAVKRIRELEALQENIGAELEALKDEVKSFMTEQNTSEIRLAGYKVKYTKYITHRFDSKAFKADYATVYEKYTKAIQATRFTIS